MIRAALDPTALQVAALVVSAAVEGSLARLVYASFLTAASREAAGNTAFTKSFQYIYIMLY